MNSLAAELVREITAPKVSFDAKVLKGYADGILERDALRAVRVTETSGAKPVSVVFFARYEDVFEILTNEPKFSVRHYTAAYKAIAPHGCRLLMHEEDDARVERYAILRTAAAQTPWFHPDGAAVRKLASEIVDDVLTTFAARRPRRFDVIGEYAFFVPYLVGVRIFGLPGPHKPSLIPWLGSLLKNPPMGRRFTPETGPYLTQFYWSQLVLGQLFANFENRSWIFRLLAPYSERRLLAHIDRSMRDVLDGATEVAEDLGIPADQDALQRQEATQDPSPTLFEALLSPDVRKQHEHVSEHTYRQHVRALVLELMGTAQAIPGMGFADVIKRWQDENLEFATALHELTQQDVRSFVDESLRLSPPAPYLLRTAVDETTLGGVTVHKGEYVCALIANATADWRRVKDAGRIKLDRDLPIYLHFGPEGGPHQCYGRHIARALLGEMFAGLKNLPALEPTEPLHEFQSQPERMVVQFAPGAARG